MAKWLTLMPDCFDTCKKHSTAFPLSFQYLFCKLLHLTLQRGLCSPVLVPCCSKRSLWVKVPLRWFPRKYATQLSTEMEISLFFKVLEILTTVFLNTPTHTHSVMSYFSFLVFFKCTDWISSSPLLFYSTVLCSVLLTTC